MNTEGLIAYSMVVSVAFAATMIGFLIYVIVTRDTRNWREEFRALQLENLRLEQKNHEENRRFFRSLGTTVGQIFERIDRGEF